MNINNGNRVNTTFPTFQKEVKEIRESERTKDAKDDSLKKLENSNTDLKLELDNLRKKIGKISSDYEESKKNNKNIEDKLSRNLLQFNLIQKQYKDKSELLSQENNKLLIEIKKHEDDYNFLKIKSNDDKISIENSNYMIDKLSNENEMLLIDIKRLNEEIKKLNDSKMKIDDFLIEEVKNGPNIEIPTITIDDKGFEIRNNCILCCENKRDVLFIECSHCYCCFNCLKNSYKKKLTKNSKISDNCFVLKGETIGCAICKINNRNFIKIIYS